MALLRGVNVGGRNKVEMKRLRTTFEAAGLAQVRTYINSGNVIFSDGRHRDELTRVLEAAIDAAFGFRVDVLLRDRGSMTATAKAIPTSWKDDAATRCYVMFLWDDIDEPAILDQLTVNKGIDRVRYVDGAIIWRADRTKLTRSGMMRVASSDLYRSMTIRNSNTVRKLVALMADADG